MLGFGLMELAISSLHVKLSLQMLNRGFDCENNSQGDCGEVIQLHVADGVNVIEVAGAPKEPGMLCRR